MKELLASVLAGSGLAVLVGSPIALEPAPSPREQPPHSAHASVRKDSEADGDSGPMPHFGTLVQLHTDERVVLAPDSPRPQRWDELLGDRATGTRHVMDPRLLGLIRALAVGLGKGGPVRVELVSGYRSPKLNENLRKKGRNVASHSQHTLGHAVDFRLVLPGTSKGVDPRQLEKHIRSQGWVGGIGTYSMNYDWFVHADVGPNRKWQGR